MRPSSPFKWPHLEGETILLRWYLCYALKASKTSARRVIDVDGNPAHPSAFDVPREQGILPATFTLRARKYLTNIVEQHHRDIMRLVKPSWRSASFTRHIER